MTSKLGQDTVRYITPYLDHNLFQNRNFFSYPYTGKGKRSLELIQQKTKCTKINLFSYETIKKS